MSQRRKGFVLGRENPDGSLTYLTQQLFWLDYAKAGLDPYVHIKDAVEAVKLLIEAGKGRWKGPEPEFIQEAVDDPVEGRKIVGERVPFTLEQ